MSDEMTPYVIPEDASAVSEETRGFLNVTLRRSQLAEQIQAPRDRCRFCGGGRAHSCEMPDGRSCRWMDKRHTICTAPQCRAQYQALTKAALAALVAPRCACGKPKSRNMAFCTACWNLLPWVMGSPLYEHIEHGFASYYGEACEFLKKLSEVKHDR